ncbi:helix-turn-helix domain-containing protein [Paenibacillus allorhizosphaerae]|uniref:Helix-turn-helix domain-containing protein n=1 Tax=Paenibacillus allorhizosphaerae TaxID=2849866 RepID=A0ABM8VUN1_9BACL|nr:helix-turn-helix domain-containing protein [Paenibacillus allorhizosphaerae]CAG7658933.1 hypothetical protein PAECIP111802_07221 [Paenibacillus allorhizosphaerae]
MREHALLRIQLLKALLELEEKLMEDCGNQSKAVAYASQVEDVAHRQENGQLKAVFSVAELSDYLGVSADCIYTMVRENQVPYVRIRRRILFHRQAIDSWIQSSAFNK